VPVPTVGGVSGPTVSLAVLYRDAARAVSRKPDMPARLPRLNLLHPRLTRLAPETIIRSTLSLSRSSPSSYHAPRPTKLSESPAEDTSKSPPAPPFHVARVGLVHGPSQVGSQSGPCLCWECLLLCVDLIRPLFRAFPYFLAVRSEARSQYLPFYLRVLLLSISAPSSPRCLRTLCRAPRYEVKLRFGHRSFAITAARVCRRQDRIRLSLFPLYSTCLSNTCLYQAPSLASSKANNCGPYLSFLLFVCPHFSARPVDDKTELRRRSPLSSRALSRRRFTTLASSHSLQPLQVFPRAFSIFQKRSLSLSLPLFPLLPNSPLL
jgi:hypothetical protein